LSGEPSGDTTGEPDPGGTSGGTGNEQLRLKPLNLTRFIAKPSQRFPNICLVGQRSSGKTRMAAGIVYKLNNPQVVVFCGTKASRAYWIKHLGCAASVITMDNVEKALSRLWAVICRQEEQVEYFETIGQQVPREYNMTLVLDDCAEEKPFIRSKCGAWLASNGRHSRIAMVTLLQFPSKILPSMRSNTDLWFLTWNPPGTLSSLIDLKVVSQPQDRDLFIELCARVTGTQKTRDGQVVRDKWGDPVSAYYGLVYHATVRSMRLEDLYSIWLKPEGFDVEKTMLGSPEWRDCMKRHYVDHRKIAILKKFRQRASLQGLDRHTRHLLKHTPSRKAYELKSRKRNGKTICLQFNFNAPT